MSLTKQEKDTINMEDKELKTFVDNMLKKEQEKIEHEKQMEAVNKQLQQMAAQQQQIVYGPGTWSSMQAVLYPGVNHYYGNIQNYKPPSHVSTGNGHFITLHTNKDNLGEHYALGVPPEEGRMYQLVCKKVLDANGQLIATFVLV